MIFHFQRHGGWTWGGGNLSSMTASVSTLGDSGWLNHLQILLAGSAWIAARVALESASVLVHCRSEFVRPYLLSINICNSWTELFLFCCWGDET